MEWPQGNQGKLGSSAKHCEHTSFGKLCLLTTDSVSSRQKLYKYDTHGKSLRCSLDFGSNYAGKNSDGLHVQQESFQHSKHEQTVIGIKYCESNQSGKIVKKRSPLICQQADMDGNAFKCNYVGRSSAASHPS